jgi:hypothetical protein
MSGNTQQGNSQQGGGSAPAQQEQKPQQGSTPIYRDWAAI